MRVAGTGHRPNKLGGYSDKAFARLVEIAEDALLDLRPKLVISGMALGWDQALAQAATNLQIEWAAYMPFPDQDAKWPEKSRAQFRRLLDNARILKHCSPGPYAPAKMQRRNEMMVDDCDLVLAMWDGSDGGTGNCLNYVRTQTDKPLINFYPYYIQTLLQEKLHAKAAVKDPTRHDPRHG